MCVYACVPGNLSFYAQRKTVDGPYGRQRGRCHGGGRWEVKTRVMNAVTYRGVLNFCWLCSIEIK